MDSWPGRSAGPFFSPRSGEVAMRLGRSQRGRGEFGGPGDVLGEPDPGPVHLLGLRPARSPPAPDHRYQRAQWTLQRMSRPMLPAPPDHNRVQYDNTGVKHLAVNLRHPNNLFRGGLYGSPGSRHAPLLLSPVLLGEPRPEYAHPRLPAQALCLPARGEHGASLPPGRHVLQPGQLRPDLRHFDLRVPGPGPNPFPWFCNGYYGG